MGFSCLPCDIFDYVLRPLLPAGALACLLGAGALPGGAQTAVRRLAEERAVRHFFLASIRVLLLRGLRLPCVDGHLDLVLRWDPHHDWSAAAVLAFEQAQPCHCEVLAAVAEDLELQVADVIRLWNDTRLPEEVRAVDFMVDCAQEVLLLNCANAALADPDRGGCRLNAQLPTGVCFAAVLRHASLEGVVVGYLRT